MIDKIKISLNDYSPNDNINWKSKEVKNCPPEKYFYKAKLYNSKFATKKFPLKLLLTANEKNNIFSLNIRGSIRKWYYQENSRKDLNSNEFDKCLKFIAEELNTELKTLLKGKITQLEVGVTLLLKSEMRNLIDCFVKYRNAERKIVKKTSLYFHFKNYNLIFYDKYLEINNNDIRPQKKRNVFNKFYLFRFEVNAKKVSGTILKSKFNTLEKLRNNWNQLPPMLEKYIDDIVFVDVISKEKETDIKDYPDFINHIAYMGIKKYGVIESINLFNKFVNTSNKKKKLEDFINIYRSNVTNELDLKRKLSTALAKKLDRLYNKSNI
ncbi:hypothetical protein BD847_0865 [Flavobacterium cutihirudinis]|uniref:Replication initiation protein n=1 Tax=Flavobacterium cutihirudinis TaxID=1265740 RepID=A0A3D9G179_9FLAO|nr:hypothetical protein [Flavobacterium cutihirudinis]RED26934.1 hypothetical protein BD847_0865 [Flavobacterium cutihirudinis]